MMNKQQYNNPRVVEFMGGLTLVDLNRVISLTGQKCQKCLIRIKNHYCMEQKCRSKQLICWSCDIKNINSKHYMHQFSYIVPLFSRDVFAGMNQILTNFMFFQTHLRGQINKIYQYIRKLEKIDQIVTNQLQRIRKEQIDRNFNVFQERVNKLISNPLDNKLSQVLNDVSFLSSSQCLQKQQQLRQQLIQQIQALKWLNDPQKQLKSLLKFQIPQESRQAFISSRKNVQFSEIDSYFRLTNQYYTESLATHKIQIKLEAQLVSKMRFYQAFIYHFRECQSLSINNGNVGHIKTPLSFKNIKTLELNCNVDGEWQSPKIDALLRDSNKMIQKTQSLLQVTHQTQNNYTYKSTTRVTFHPLKNLQNSLIANPKKTQIALSLKSEHNLKLRGFMDIQPSFIRKIHSQFLRLNKKLTKVVITGVKPIDIQEVMYRLQEMPYLMTYNITYDNNNLISELSQDRVKRLNNNCKQRKLKFYSLAKNVKFKIYEQKVMNQVFKFLYG